MDPNKNNVDAITTLIFKRSFLRKRWNDIQVLIVDEISMLSPQLFDKLEEIARIVRHDQRPFGGIQLILTGDFLQLETVFKNPSSDNRLIVESELFMNMFKNSNTNFMQIYEKSFFKKLHQISGV